MDLRLKAALACYLIIVILTVPFAFLYLFRPEFMPHHAAVVGLSWADVDPAFQSVILGLMRAVGAGWLSLSIAVLVLIAMAFREKVSWAFWAIPLIALPAEATNLYVVIKMALTTPAEPPWEFPAVKGVLLIAGIILSVIPAKKAKSIAAT